MAEALLIAVPTEHEPLHDPSFVKAPPRNHDFWAKSIQLTALESTISYNESTNLTFTGDRLWGMFTTSLNGG